MLWNNDYYSRLEEALGEHYTIKAARSHQDAIDYIEKVHLHPVTSRCMLWSHQHCCMPAEASNRAHS